MAARAEGGVDRAGVGVAGDAEARPPADARDEAAPVGQRVNGVNGVEEPVDEHVLARAVERRVELGRKKLPRLQPLARRRDSPTVL